jgi:hypothetical protein
MPGLLSDYQSLFFSGGLSLLPVVGILFVFCAEPFFERFKRVALGPTLGKEAIK